MVLFQYATLGFKSNIKGAKQKYQRVISFGSWEKDTFVRKDQIIH